MKEHHSVKLRPGSNMFRIQPTGTIQSVKGTRRKVTVAIKMKPTGHNTKVSDRAIVTVREANSLGSTTVSLTWKDLDRIVGAFRWGTPEFKPREIK